jgi:hypothetical protein
MTGRGRMAWRVAGVAVATLVVMAGCSTGAPAPDRPASGRDAGGTTAAPLPAAVTLPPAPSGRPAAGLVGSVGSDPTSSFLARLDPTTLRPLAGPRVKLEVNMVGWSVSPDRSLAVIGDGNGNGLVQVVDLGAMRSLGTVEVGAGATLVASAWLGRRRVAAVLGGTAGPADSVEVAVLDPVARRVLARRTVTGQVSAAGHLPGGLVLLLTPARGIGPVRLAVIAGPGTVRTVTLGRVSAGFKPPKVEGPDAVGHQRGAGLAVDPAGRRAFVVAPGAPVAEVGLGDLAVAYHDLDRPASPLDRLRQWLLPAVEAKAVSGPWRQARWVGGGLLAVASGEARVAHDAGGELVQREGIAGVQLVDTARWRAYDLHANASMVGYQGGRLLLSGGTWYSDATSSVSRGVGLTVYGPGNRRPLHLLGRQFVQDVTVRGDLAYLWLTREQSSGYAVVDLRSGKTLHTWDSDPPTLLLGAASW